MTDDGSPKASGRDRLGVVLGLLRADTPESIQGAPEAWPRWEALMPHVLAAVQHAADLSVQRGSTVTADALWLMKANVRLLTERALAVAEAVSGPDHPGVVAMRANLDSLR